EGVSLCGFPNASLRGLGERLIRGEVLDQLARLVRRQRFEDDRRSVRMCADPTRMLFHQVGTRDAEENQRRLVGQDGDLLDELQEGRLSPLDVVEDAHEWLCAGGRFEQAADRK